MESNEICTINEEKYVQSEPVFVNESKLRICKHICEKKRRRCKFNAINNCDFCVEHLAFNDQSKNAEKRVICPLDPKHSVYAKNFEKHLKRCNAQEKTLGDFDIKNINVRDFSGADLDNDLNNNNNENNSNDLFAGFTTYKELDNAKFKILVDFLLELEKKFNLYDLEYERLENEYLNKVLLDKNEKNKKHLKQISSIVCQVNKLLKNDSTSTCLVEMGAGRGKLSYWFEQSRIDSESKEEKSEKKKVNILLVERGSQRYKFDSLLRQDKEEACTKFERLRIDLKDLYVNKVPLIEASDNYILYGKHLCGIATDFAIRLMKNSLEENAGRGECKFGGFVLAVCCHHQCEWEAFCGKEFFEKELKLNSNMFYIIRSVSSWGTCGKRENLPEETTLFGESTKKLGRICKNLMDYARLHYLNNSIKINENYQLHSKLFYYIDEDVTLENSMIFVELKKKLK